MRKASTGLLCLGLALLGILACGPSIEDISGATVTEIRTACRELESVGHELLATGPAGGGRAHHGRRGRHSHRASRAGADPRLLPQGAVQLMKGTIVSVVATIVACVVGIIYTEWRNTDPHIAGTWITVSADFITLALLIVGLNSRGNSHLGGGPSTAAYRTPAV